MMLAILAVLGQTGSTPPAAVPAEKWAPWLTWACVIERGKAKGVAMNGLIARRDEPGHPVESKRHERALRVLRDDSGTYAGQQARWPQFVVHPKAYWAFFAGSDGKAFGPDAPSITLTKDAAGLPVEIELFAGRARGAKPYASGPCIGRWASKEAKS